MSNAEGAGRVKVSATYDPRAGTSGFTVKPGALSSSVTVTTAKGFEQLDDGQYQWDGVTENPVLNYYVSFEEPRTVNRELGGPMTADPGPWALVDRSSVVAPTEGVIAYPSIRTAGPGYVTSSWIFLGSVKEYSQTVDGETIVLVVPEEAAPVSQPETILAQLATTSRELDVGERSEKVTVLALPSVDITTPWGGVAHRSNVIVRAGKPVTTEPSVWIHEYTHTRQRFGYTNRTQWLGEASATYFSGYESLQQGRLSYPVFNDRFSDQTFENATLADSESWESEFVPYYKGGQALAHLDEQIRIASDGEHTLAEVFKTFNNRYDTVRLGDFEKEVATVSTPETAADFMQYVTTPKLAPAPENESNYVGSVTDDPDDDGLSNRAEIQGGTSPFNADSDSDGLSDQEESEIGTDPTTNDTDNDGLLDQREKEGETDPTTADTDNDGLTDGEEIEIATDPTVSDTDGDGLDDGSEQDRGSSPRYVDTDGDGLDDATEVDIGTSAHNADTDGDGLSDRVEYNGRTDPTAADTDDDLYGDAAELDVGTDPTVPTGKAEYLRATATKFLDGVRG